MKSIHDNGFDKGRGFAMRIMIFYLLGILVLAWPGLSLSQEYLDEKEIEDVWTVHVSRYGKSMNDWSVIASVNGKITYGDRLRIRIPLSTVERCSVGNMITTFYTTNIDTEEKVSFIRNKILPAELNGKEMYVKVLFALPFMKVHLAYIDMSWNKLENIKEYFDGVEEISLLLKDRNSVDGITILNSDYFDIPSNSYSTRGLNSALDRAQAECERLFNILKTT